MARPSTKPIRFLLHGEDGCVPYLTPHLLRKHFPPTETMIEEHFLLGIAVCDSCIVPVFPPKEGGAHEKDEKDNDNEEEDGGRPPVKMRRRLENDKASKQVGTPRKVKITAKTRAKKPTGYDFVPKSIHSYLAVPPGYHTILVPTFDSFHVPSTATCLPSSEQDAAVKQTKRTRPSSSNEHQQQKQLSPPLPIHCDKTMTLSTPNGHQKILPQTYATLAASMTGKNQNKKSTTAKSLPSMDAVVPLFDMIVPSATNPKKRQKRYKTASNRTDSWFRSFFDAFHPQQAKQPQQSEHSGKKENMDVTQSDQAYFQTPNNTHSFPGVWRPIVNHHVIDHDRTTPAQEEEVESMKKHQSTQSPNTFSGVVLVGWHILDSRKNRLLALQCAVSQNPMVQDVAVLSASNLTQIIDAAMGGATVIGSDWPTRLARSKQALVVDVCGWNKQQLEQSKNGHPNQTNKTICNAPKKDDNGNSNKCSGILLHLSDKQFAMDDGPLQPHCSCLACHPRSNSQQQQQQQQQHQQHYSRAYIHHLIQSKEMLAEILLFGHNLFVLIHLFVEMSLAKEMGLLKEFCQHLESQMS